MTCMIIDDNPIARDILVQLTSQVDDLVVACECSNAIEAYNYLQKNNVDVLLLDIEMPEMTGLELTKNLGNKDVVIIFTTSKKDYAVEAFELNVADYLVKPFAPSRFIQAIEKARYLIDGVEGDELLFIRDSNVVRKLRMNDILYVEAMGDYVKFFTVQKLYAIHVTFKTAEDRLPTSKFIKVHRSYIVAVDKIDTLRDGGVVIGDRFIPVADGYRKSLNKRINII